MDINSDGHKIYNYAKRLVVKKASTNCVLKTKTKKCCYQILEDAKVLFSAALRILQSCLSVRHYIIMNVHHLLASIYFGKMAGLESVTFLFSSPTIY